MKLAAFALAIVFGLTSCGVNKAVDAAGSMPDKMDDTLNEMKKTNEVVNQQPVQIAFEDMLKPELGQDLDPIPFDIIPFAKKFGQFASADDVVQIVYLWMKKLNELTLDKDAPTVDDTAAFNHHKMQVFAALQAVCGLLTDAKVNQIISTEINNDGRYQEAALNLLMLRVRFLRDVMLEASLFSSPLDSVGKLEEAVEYAKSIDTIARLKYPNDIQIKVTGFLAPMPTIQEVMDTTLALQTWQKIKTKADRSLTVGPKEYTGDPATDALLLQDRQARYNNAMNTVNQKITGWTTLHK